MLLYLGAALPEEVMYHKMKRGDYLRNENQGVVLTFSVINRGFKEF